MTAIVACSWNVHECVGADGRRDPARVAAVLREVDADVCALQEVHSDARRGGELDQAGFLAESLDLEAVTGFTLQRRGGGFGNVLLTRLPVLFVRRHDLSVSGREPRGALEVGLGPDRRPLRVVVTHLGLRAAERTAQTRMLLDRVGVPGPAETLLVVGDWNEWLPWRASLRVARRCFGAFPAPPTFPARRPVLALDRAWVAPRERLLALAAHRSPLAALASDHLPLVARLHSATASSPENESRSGPDRG